MTQRPQLDNWFLAVDGLFDGELSAEIEPEVRVERLQNRIPTRGRRVIEVLDCRTTTGRRVILRVREQDGSEHNVSFPVDALGELAEEMHHLQRLL
jgi:hypothetical protein